MIRGIPIPRFEVPRRGVWLNSVRAAKHSLRNSFLSMESSLPLESPDSYMDTGGRCEARWLARSNSCDPSAAESKSRRLRTLASSVEPRPVLRTFALKRDLPSGLSLRVEDNRPNAARLVRPPLGKGSLERQQAQPTSPASEANLPYTSQPTRAARTTPTIKMNFWRYTEMSKLAPSFARPSN
jgi:hypothetical protein